MTTLNEQAADDDRRRREAVDAVKDAVQTAERAAADSDDAARERTVDADGQGRLPNIFPPAHAGNSGRR